MHLPADEEGAIEARRDMCFVRLERSVTAPRRIPCQRSLSGHGKKKIFEDGRSI